MHLNWNNSPQSFGFKDSQHVTVTLFLSCLPPSVTWDDWSQTSVMCDVTPSRPLSWYHQFVTSRKRDDSPHNDITRITVLLIHTGHRHKVCCVFCVNDHKYHPIKMVSYWPLAPLSCRISVNNNYSNEGVLTKQLFQDPPPLPVNSRGPQAANYSLQNLGPAVRPQLHLFCHFDNYNVICNIQLRWSRWTGCNGPRRHLHYKPLVKRKWSLFIFASLATCAMMFSALVTHPSARVCDSLTPWPVLYYYVCWAPLAWFILGPETHFIWS